MAEELTPAQQAAALHGWASNRAVPLAERLQAALQALEFYEEQSTILATARESDDWDPGAMVMLYDMVVDDRDKAADTIIRAKRLLHVLHPAYRALDEYHGPISP